MPQRYFVNAIWARRATWENLSSDLFMMWNLMWQQEMTWQPTRMMWHAQSTHFHAI